MLKRTFSKTILCFILVLSILFSLNFIPLQVEVTSAMDIKQISVSNSDFTDTQSFNPVDIPNNWEEIKGPGADSTLSGSIDVSAAGFETKYQTQNPGKSGSNDTRVLMINAKNNTASKGYKTSIISLEASSFYKFSVWARTLNNGYFSIYLVETLAELDEFGKNKEVVVKDITNNDASFSYGNVGWNEYTFFIETHSIMATNVHLELWLGERGVNGAQSTGAVFFDTVTLNQLNSNKYDEYYELTKANPRKVINLKNERTVIDAETNPLNSADPDYINYNFGFEEITNEKVEGWEQVEKYGDILIQGQDYRTNLTYNNNTNTQIKLEPHGFYNNGYNTLLLTTENNLRKGSTKLESKEIEIKQNERYLLSIIAKSNIADTASVEITTTGFYKNGTEANIDADKPSASQKISQAGSTNSSINKGWQKYNFIINGNPNYDTKIKINLMFASQNSLASGYVAFDDIVLEKVTKDEIDTAINFTNVTTLNLYTPQTGSVANGSFDYVNYVTWEGINQNGNVVYPLEAVSNWSHNPPAENQKDNIQFGIIDTNKTHFDAQFDNQNYKFTNPGTLSHELGIIDSTNNVLMMKNNVSNITQSFTSDGFTLSQNSYIRISGYVNRPYSSGNAFIQLQNEVSVISKITLPETDNPQANNWQAFEFIIKTNFVSRTISVTLGLENAYGVVFFDNIEFETLSITDVEFKAKSNTTLSKIIDFSYETFNQYKEPLTNGDYIHTAPQFDQTIGEAATFGIVDLNSSNPAIDEMRQIGETHNQISSNLLYLYHDHLAPTASTFSLKDKFYLNSGEYFRISVILNAKGINNENPFEATSGFNISLSKINAEIKNIKTFSGYREFNFYIKATETTETTLTFSFGSNENKASGEIFIRYIQAETISKEEFTAATNKSITVNQTNLNMSQYNMIIGNTEVQETPPETTTPTTPTAPTEFPWVVIPSLIMGLALLLVIAKVAVDNFGIKKAPKAANISNADYDKNYTNRKPTLKEKLAKIAMEDTDMEETDTKTENDKKPSKLRNFIKKIALPDKDKKN